MKGFSLKDVCRALVNDLQTSISQKSRIKLSIDIQLPDYIEGDSDTLVSTSTWLAKWLESRLINGIISIDITKRSLVNDDGVLTVDVTGLGTKGVNAGDFFAAASQFALMLPSDVRVKGEDDRVVFEFSMPFHTSESAPVMRPAFLHKCILIAEDSEINALVFSGFMEEWGCDITVVGNGKEALNRLVNHAYDLVLMDIHMPVMGGNEAIRGIRVMNKSIPIIALTASTHEGDIKESLDSGANDYILKPVASKTLFSVLQKYLAPADQQAFFH